MRNNNQDQSAAKASHKAARHFQKLARQELDKGQTGEAIRKLAKSLYYEPDNSINQRFFGALLISQDRYDEAELAFQAILARDPDNLAAVSGLAACLSAIASVDETRIEDAIAALQNLLFLDENSLFADQMLGKIFHCRGDYGAACYHFDSALRKQPDDPEIMCNYAEVLYDLEFYDETEVLLQRAAQADDPSFEGALNLVDFYAKTGQLQKAYNLSVFLLPKLKNPEDLADITRAVKRLKRIKEVRAITPYAAIC